MDTVSKVVRSQIMSKVKASDTKPEIALRKALFAQGIRYRLHVKHMPGKPDILLPRFKLAIFINGCFWHWHGCKRCRLPLDNREYWIAKIGCNGLRDKKNYGDLRDMGWRVLLVWECALKKAYFEQTIAHVMKVIASDIPFASVEPDAS